jgi:ATP adenylyltransferase
VLLNFTFASFLLILLLSGVHLMEHIFSPWRYRYVSANEGQSGCVFCRVQTGNDRENFVVHRAQLNFVILNLFPYTTGHLMIVPYEHTSTLTSISEAVSCEMMELAKTAHSALHTEYRPDGFNIGMNLGKSAGAGVADHIHLHVVPRWVGDANFVSIVGETRVLPEDLTTTFEKLQKHFEGGA